MSFPYGAGFSKVNPLIVEPSVSDIHGVYPTHVDHAEPAGTDAQQGPPSFLRSTTTHEKTPSLKKVSSKASNRPGRRGNWCCARCRKHKNSVKKPCEIDPNDANRACYSCIKAGLATSCGGKLPPPKMLERLLQEIKEGQLQREVKMSAPKAATQLEISGLSDFESVFNMPSTPEQAEFFDRFAKLRNLDLNICRPVHGLDQQSLISDPNVELGISTSMLFPFEQQETVVSLEHMHPSPSLTDQGFPEFPISTPDLQPIISILSSKFPSLDQSSINNAVTDMLAQLRNMNESTKAQGYSPRFGSHSEAMGDGDNEM